eukprot:c12809_g1_i2 orf=1-243(-)
MPVTKITNASTFLSWAKQIPSNTNFPSAHTEKAAKLALQITAGLFPERQKRGMHSPKSWPRCHLHFQSEKKKKESQNTQLA